MSAASELRLAARAPRARRSLVVVLATLLAVAILPLPAAAATTTGSVASSLLTMTNQARKERGLKPLRLDTRLADIAVDRAMTLAGATSFSHAAAGGSLTPVLGEAGVQWYAWAENIAWVPGGLNTTTAAFIFHSWKDSASHWTALMSRTLNYVGFGAALRSSDGRVFASAVFTESRDHTAPGAAMDTASRSGTSISFRWHGYDPALQTHWAGIRDFDVWYRVDSGTWRRIRDNTTQTSLTLSSRPRGHRYSLRVQARDRAYNVGRPSSTLSVWVP